MKFIASTKIRSLVIPILLIVVIIVGWVLLGPVLSKKEIRNVVLISIDTCRADHLSCYGYSRKTTANIDAVAAKGILFNHVVASAPFTLPSHSSMLTGTVPPYHGVHGNIGYQLDESNVTLAEILKQNGYATGAVISSFVLDAQFGLDQGFDYYNDDFVQPISGFYHNERRGGEATRFANEWLTENKNEPFFLFLHYYDPHDGYQPPEPFATEFKDNLYAGEIAYVDHCIGQVIEKLKALDLYNSTLLIITSDHGEGLNEHLERTHGYFIYHSTVHVPIIIKIPGVSKGRKIDSVAGLVDIVPTVCSLLNITPGSVMQGKDLSPLFMGKSEAESQQRYIYCESFDPTQYGCNPLLGVVDGRWKYIQAPRQELYDLVEDVGEKENLIHKHPKLARVMQDNLKLILQEQVRTNLSGTQFALDDENRKRLESLGYIGISSGASESFEFDDTKDDPKDWIRLSQQVMLVNSYLKVKQYDTAETIIRRMIAEKPEYLPSYFMLGRIAFEQNNIDESITHFSGFLSRVDKADDQSHKADLSHYLNQYIYRAHSYLGDALAGQGKINLAIANYEKALDLVRATSQKLLVDEIEKKLKMYKNR